MPFASGYGGFVMDWKRNVLTFPQESNRLLEVCDTAFEDLLILFARNVLVQVLSDTFAVSHFAQHSASGEVMPSIAIMEVLGLK